MNVFPCPFTDIKLRYCDVSTAGSCCNLAMETKMAAFSKQVMEKNTRDVISKMSSTLQTRAQKFNGEL
jgi:glypican 4